MARFLMCSPEHYGIEYEINPWMSRARGAEPELAGIQWKNLHTTLTETCGATVELVKPQTSLPDMVFTANAGLVLDQRVILSRFRFPVRSGEEAHYETWFQDNGFEVIKLSEDVFFEGAGDALFCGDELFCGYHFRSEIRSHHEIAEITGRRVLSLQLVDPRYYHLDTCFCPLTDGRVIYTPAAFDEYARKVIEENIPEPIPVSGADAARFGCNAVCIENPAAENHVVLPLGCMQLVKDLTDRGYRTHSINLSEYLKAGGAAKCLTLRLD